MVDDGRESPPAVLQQDPNAVLMQYWITHPSPNGQDEFSTATYSMFSNGDPNTGTCKTQ